MIKVRQAVQDDAQAMSDILGPILASWNSPRPFSVDHVTANYIEHADGLGCHVATGAGGEVLGFQSLLFASAGNAFDLPVGYGIIGTYVNPKAQGTGVGRALFDASLRAAKAAGIEKIDATIGADNAAGLAYYEAIGFRTYKTLPGAICKLRQVQG